MLRTSIHSFLNKYPYNSSVDREELICSFFPGNVYKGDFNPFVKDGVIICFNNFSSVDDLTLEMIQQWTKEVTSSLDTVIAQLISKPTPPRNIRANGHDLRQFIDRFKAKNSDEDIYSDDSHSPGDIENIGNDIETEKQLLIQQRYPKYLNSLKSYLDRINSCASLKYKLYGMAFIGRRHTCNAVYLLDMIALSNEAGWSIDFPIADQQNLYQCYVNKLFSFYSEHELILVLEELILKTPNKKNHAIQRLSIGEDKLTWTLDLTVNLSSRNNNGLLKAIYLDYTTKRAINKDAHLLHRIIRAVELLSDLTICVYVYWNDAFDNNIRTRELLSFDSPPEDIIANLGLMGISNRAPGVRDRCLMILANKKVRFIVTREWSIT